MDEERSETKEVNELEGGCRSRTERRSGGTNCKALKFPSRRSCGNLRLLVATLTLYTDDTTV